MCNLQLVFALGEKGEIGKENIREFSTMMRNGGSFNRDAWGYFTNEGYIKKEEGKFDFKNITAADTKKCATARFMIGHNRLATHGVATEPNNNHPLQSERFIWVHNGILSNFKNIAKKLKINYTKEVDSGIIGVALEKILLKKKGGLEKSITQLAGMLGGSFAVLIYDKQTHRLFFFKNGTPDFTFALVDKKFIFGSTKKTNMGYLGREWSYGFWVDEREVTYTDPADEVLYELNNTLGLKFLNNFDDKDVIEDDEDDTCTTVYSKNHRQRKDCDEYNWRGYGAGYYNSNDMIDILEDVIDEGNALLLANGESLKTYFEPTKKRDKIRINGNSKLLKSLGIKENSWYLYQFRELLKSMESYCNLA